MTSNTEKNTQSIHIAFIGLGNMGAPMAINLLKSGYPLTVFDLSDIAMQQLKAAGAKIADTAQQAVEGAQVVISMLPAGQHVKALYLGEHDSSGLFSHLPKNTLVIDSSTIAAADARAVADAAKLLGIEFLDAPVSGGTAGAAAGTLTFIVGGDKIAFNRAKPLLECMGKNIFHAGASGAGQVAKICNNMLLGILMAGTSEALNLGVQNGLDAKVLSDIMLQSSGRNWTLEVYNPYPNVMANVPSSNQYQGGFMSKLMHKDLNLALQTARDTQAQTPMADQATQLYDKHIAIHGDKDFSSIIERYQSNET